MEERKGWSAEDLEVFRRAYALSLKLHRELHRASLSFPRSSSMPVWRINYGGLRGPFAP